MYTLLLVVQILLAVGVIVLVLLQHGKGADAGAAFGSGASGTVFGSRGAGSFLTRATAVLATLFFANSLLLSTPLVIGGGEGPASVTEQIRTAPTTTGMPTDEVPAAPADLPNVPIAPAAPAGDSDLP
ncbi:MAG: preprotein translocase subunit SecG [Thiohalobacteraceae bacterium]|nr:preprotein translocase subunit SecG [Gammaproteobacteria bacterium]